uniref:N-acetylmuramoyl-L-alanine amidase n=1 Tax=Dactylococcopsis salina TaxID=292566 RepID=UPI00059BB25E|nr:N-acetylmuramoyl-L-alanine amidase [Dactylococcopsis salina]
MSLCDRITTSIRFTLTARFQFQLILSLKHPPEVSPRSALPLTGMRILVEKRDRPSSGVFGNTLALTRPHTTLAVLLELGFMIHPTKFEWIMNPQEQEKLAATITQGIQAFFRFLSSPPLA